MSNETADIQQDNTGTVAADSNSVVDATQAAEAPKQAEPVKEQPAAESKPDGNDSGLLKDEKPEENNDGLLSKKTDAEVAKAPDAYEAFKLNGEAIDEASQKEAAEVAKSMNMTQEEAQRSFEYADAVVSRLVAEHEKAQREFREANAKEWAEKDRDGRLQLQAEEGLKHLGLRNYVIEQGMQYDAKLMSAFAEIGRLVSEGRSVSGQPAVAQVRAYPNSPSLYKN